MLIYLGLSDYSSVVFSKVSKNPQTKHGGSVTTDLTQLPDDTISIQHLSIQTEGGKTEYKTKRVISSVKPVGPTDRLLDKVVSPHYWSDRPE